jgi:peptide/nickel transport system permease protein
MLKEALRRLLWLGPTLLLVTIPGFWAVAKLEDPATTPGTEPLPLFFNLRPTGAGERAVAAATRVAAGSGSGTERPLEALGGAALPHVLPLFDSLGPEARGRVAVALAPIARRMGIGNASELEVPESAVLFWTQFWEEHAIDFRSAVVRRTVRRFADHPSALRRAEVVDLDTVALPDLVDAMRPLRTSEDVARVRQICDAAAHVTQKPWTIPDGATPRDARAVVDHWEAFFLEHQSDYVALSGTRRLAATLLQTRYGRWAAQLGRRRLGALKDGRSVAATLQRRGPTTLTLVLSGLLLGYPLAALWGTLAALRGPRMLAIGSTLAAILVAGLTSVGIATLTATLFGWGHVGSSHAMARAGFCMALGGAALASRHQRAIVRRLAELPHVRTSLAFGASPLRTALRDLKRSLPVLIALAVADLPGLLTAAFVTERALRLHGLGETTADAMRSGDPVWLMAVALVGMFALGVAQIGADLLAAFLDPRIRDAREQQEAEAVP